MNIKNGIKVLLIYPNPMMDNLIPVGVSLLSACLKKAGHQTKLFDTTFYESGEKTGDFYREKNLAVIKTDLSVLGIERIKRDMIEDFKEAVRDYQPDLIALSVFEVSYTQGIKLLRGVKDLKIPTIVGGVHATLSPEEVIRENGVDMVCIGDGEDALVELADRIRDREPITDIKNLWIKKGNEIIKNDIGPPKNLDEVPFQDWEIYDKKRLYKPFLGEIRATGGFESNRGCVHSCTYCCNSAFRRVYQKYGGFYREKSMERLIAEITYFKNKYDLGFVMFVDGDFLSGGEARFLKFIELYQSLKIPFWCETRAENITEKRVKLLEEAGCKGIALGVESGNQKIRYHLLKKYISDETIIKAFQMLRKSKIIVCANNMIGFPYESRKEIFDTIELNRKLNLNNPIVNIFNPYRGTELRDICVKKGYISEDTLAGDYRGQCVLNMPQISKEELLGLQRTFPLYVKLPKLVYPLIRLAEKSDLLFKVFSNFYTWLYLRKR